jgi:hypothetical protein
VFTGVVFTGVVFKWGEQIKMGSTNSR